MNITFLFNLFNALLKKFPLLKFSIQIKEKFFSLISLFHFHLFEDYETTFINVPYFLISSSKIIYNIHKRIKKPLTQKSTLLQMG